MKTTNLKKLLVAAVLIGISTTLAHAENPDTQAKLAKPLKIELKDVTIAEALEKIGQKAGVKFVLSDEAIWKLPHGEATRLSVSLQGPLAESMKEMLNAFFMRYAVGTEQITIYPRPELDHVLGKPTAKQLELLKAVYANVIHESEESPLTTINNILGQNVVFVPNDLSKEIEKNFSQMHFPITVANLINRLIHGEGYQWYLAGSDFPNQLPEIRAVPIDEFRKAKLNQIVDISFDESAETIIQKLANWTGLQLYIEKLDSNWLQEPLSVEMQNITLKQALTNIVTMVDGKIVIDGGYNFIEIKEKPHPRKPRTARAPGSRLSTSRSGGGGMGGIGGGKLAGDEYVGKISIPMEGGKYFIEFMLRQSDLTDELIKLRQQKITDILGEPPKPKPKLTTSTHAPPKKSD